jgi:hypothetical protein
MTRHVYYDSRKLALYWHLRELAEEPHEDDDAGTSYHERDIALDALRAEEDVLTALERIRHEAWRRPLERQHAAELITDYCWPDDSGHQRPVWETDYVHNRYDLEARRRMGTYSPPVDPADYDGRTGYHHGGVWFPHINSAKPLACPECGFTGEFWNFELVDAGKAHEPTHECRCGWQPDATLNLYLVDGRAEFFSRTS